MGRGSILVVEDNDDFRKYILSILEDHEFFVTGESRADKAVDRIIGGEIYSLIIMDLSFEKGLSGLSAIEDIRHYSKRQIPIISLSIYSLGLCVRPPDSDYHFRKDLFDYFNFIEVVYSLIGIT
jgi:CheY-like chemotaxis protein